MVVPKIDTNMVEITLEDYVVEEVDLGEPTREGRNIGHIGIEACLGIHG